METALLEYLDLTKFELVYLPHYLHTVHIVRYISNWYLLFTQWFPVLQYIPTMFSTKMVLQVQGGKRKAKAPPQIHLRSHRDEY